MYFDFLFFLLDLSLFLRWSSLLRHLEVHQRIRLHSSNYKGHRWLDDSLWLEVAGGLVSDDSRLDEDMINFITVCVL